MEKKTAKKISLWEPKELKRPLVSVCMLTYNHEDFIIKALDSVLIQVVDFPVEIVLHDDASTDRTKEILESYNKKHPKLFNLLLQEDNQRSKLGGGMNPRFNYPRSKGKYIALLDGDDYWTDPLKLQKQINFLQENEGFVGVFHNTTFIDERQNNPKPKMWRTYDRDVFTSRDTIRKLSLFHTSSYCFRNLDYNFQEFTKKNISSGDMFLLGVISKYGKLKLLDKPMSVYRKNFGGVTNESILKFHKSRIKLNNALNSYFEGRYRDRAKTVINYHKNQLFILKYPRLNKIKNIILSKLT